MDFDSLDGHPTNLFFVLGLKIEELHLPWLAKLSQMFAVREAVKAVLEAANAESIFSVLVDGERRLGVGDSAAASKVGS